MFVYLGATLTCTGLGWLIGPSFGSTAWSLLHRRQASRMAQRDKQFFDHIRKMRADPTRQVVHNPLPDYYVRYRKIVKLTCREKKLARFASIVIGFASRYVYGTPVECSVYSPKRKKKEQGRRGTSLIHKSGEGTEREQILTGITANIPSESFTWRRGSPIIHAATCIAAAWRKRLSVRAS